MKLYKILILQNLKIFGSIGELRMSSKLPAAPVPDCSLKLGVDVDGFAATTLPLAAEPGELALLDDDGAFDEFCFRRNFNIALPNSDQYGVQPRLDRDQR